MTLSAALNSATAALQSSQAQTAVVSRNIANVNTAGATRKYVEAVTATDGRVEVRSIAQSQNSSLFRNLLDTTASLAAATSATDGLDRIGEVIGDTDAAGSPAARLGKLSAALQTFSATPSSAEFARNAVQSAQDMAGSLADLSASVTQVRRDADDALATAADDMNTILAKIEQLNTEIVRGTAGRTDVTDQIDERNRQITKLAEYVGVSVQSRGNNDVALYTDSGVTLFDRSARAVDFTATSPLASGAAGAVFRIDGTPVTGDSSVMKVTGGKVAGLVQLRDVTTVAFDGQLDQIARGLISAFSETKTVGGTTTTLQGVFGASDADKPGVAGRLQVAASVIADPTRLRSVVNDGADRMTGDTAAGFNGRINQIIDRLGERRSFTATGTLASGSLAEFAASSVGWLQAGRQSGQAGVDYQSTLLAKTNETLTDATGINLETELTKLLDLQRSFQASSKIITTVDQMMAALLQAV